MNRERGLRGIAPVGVLFLVNAAMWTSIGPRLADVAERIGVTEGALGLALTLQAVGLIAATFVSPWLVRRFGLRRVAVVSAVAYCLATMLPGFAGTWTMLAAACLVSGFANGPYDLSMNLLATDLEERTKRTLMPRFEVWFNVGLLGSTLAATAAADFIGVAQHLAIVGVAGALAILALARRLPDAAASVSDEPSLREAVRSIPRADRWRVAALSAVAAVGLWAELMIPDWSSLLFAQEFDATGSARGYGAVLFTSGLLISLWITGRLTDRFGARRLVLAGAVLFGVAMVGLALAPSIPVACALLFVAGAGIAPTHPLAISEAGAMAAKTVVLPVVMMSGYVGLSVQRPVNGVLAEAFTLSTALTISSIVVLAIVLLCVGAFSAKPRSGEETSQ